MAIEKRRLPDEIREQVQEKLKDRLHSNADFQRRNSMTPTERGRDAIDRITKLNKDYAEKHGKELTDSQARAFAQEIAERSDRRK